MRLRHVEPIALQLGDDHPLIPGETSIFRAYRVDRHGCRPCPCGYRSLPDDVIWCNNYADLRCSTCMQQHQAGEQ